MDQFPSQSHKASEPREIQPITREPGRVRKAPAGRRLLATFFQGDAQMTWTSMIWDSFFPNLRDNVEDSVINGIHTLFGGTSSRSYYGGVRRGGLGVSRNQISRHNPDSALGARGAVTEHRMSREDRINQRLDVIEIASRAEAEDVLAAMLALIDQYDLVRLAEFYQMVHITPDHTDYSWGWEDLGGAKVVHSHGIYFLDLPQPIKIK